MTRLAISVPAPAGCHWRERDREKMEGSTIIVSLGRTSESVVIDRAALREDGLEILIEFAAPYAVRALERHLHTPAFSLPE